MSSGRVVSNSAAPSRNRATAARSDVTSSRWSARLYPAGHGTPALAARSSNSLTSPTTTGLPWCMSSAVCSSSKVRCAGWWIESITTRSCAASSRSVDTRRWADAESKPDVGSSSSKTRGEQTMHIAIATRRRSPPDTRCIAAALPPSCVSAMCERPSERSVSSTAADRSAALAPTGSVSCAANQTHSRGVSVSDKLSSWRTYATIAGRRTPCSGIA
mmetsp:Transcript_6140/g.19241  ORF Transcript_6140/g.19241 Transcript_6140/m.19241 type:complete len:217 (-) Transcript_6140:894-1544(-)